MKDRSLDKVYAVHEYGSPSHFNALDYLINNQGGKLIYRELSLYSQLSSAIKNMDYLKLKKFLTNVYFLLTIPFARRSKVVLAVAPYNHYLRIWSRLFAKHEVYYFTSYTCWDQSRMVHSFFFNDNLVTFWKDYLRNTVKHIFAVSELAKTELIKNGFSTEQNISVVNHSFLVDISPNISSSKSLKFITVASLEKKKGIDDLIEFFKDRPSLKLTIVGKGSLMDDVKKASELYPNIEYKGFIKGLDNLAEEYKKHSYLILNSKRTEIWEELFGMVVIEGMACGLVPITTDHPGPKEVITNGVNGFICREGDILSGIQSAVQINDHDFNNMRNQAIIKGSKYSVLHISMKWNKVCD